MRDWSKTLWPASWRGASFWVERDEDAGGRRAVIHEFPNRDDPFIEDLGEKPRLFTLTAYFVGDTADTQSAALVAACALRGPGTLVLPSIGPMQVHCTEYHRSRERDRMGYEAFTLQMVRAGATSPFASVASLANLLFAASDMVGMALAAATTGAMSLAGVSAHVSEAAVDCFRDQVATLEALRTEARVDVAVSAPVRDQLTALYQEAPALISRHGMDSSAVARLFEATRAIADGIDPTLCLREMASIIDAPAPPLAVLYPTTSTRAVAKNTITLARAGRIAALAAAAEAIERVQFDSRAAAITARADFVARTEREMADLPGAPHAPLFRALQMLQGSVVDYLAARVIDLAPVVTVSAPLSMPSLWWGWRLYSNPVRGAELVARNSVPHPSFMPVVFEALAV